MDRAEFDLFADEYDTQHRTNIAITGETPAYFSAYKIKIFAQILRDRSHAAERMIDFGAGIGNSLPYFREFLPQTVVTCADVSSKSLELAKARFPGPEIDMVIEGDRIPCENESFDAAFSACVFHHIPEIEHQNWLAELRRVTKIGGVLTVFEHNPRNPLTVRAVNTCPFDVNARLIPARRFAALWRAAGWDDMEIRYHVFFPRAFAFMRVLDRHLGKIPFGAQYSVTATRRR